MPQDAAKRENSAPDVSSVSTQALDEQLDKFGAKTPPKTFIEGQVTWMMIIALSAIGLLCVGTIALWFYTLPSVNDVEAICKTSADAAVDPAKRVEMFTSLRKAHTDGFKDMFQLVVLSGLIPIFTLLAGYVFGTRQQQESE